MAVPALLERETDLALLAGSLESLRADGTGGVVLVEGPPGIGKTALVQAALDGVRSAGLTVLRARGSELEAVLAFGGVRQLFARAMHELDDGERAALLDGPAGLARPVLGLAPREDETQALGDPLYGLFWLAVELSERSPLVLVVDDLQWLDDESGRFAAYLADRVDGVAVLLLATARPDEPGGAAGPVTTIAARATVIHPQPLSEQAVGVLLERAGADGFRATGGNPLFVTELRRALADAPGVAVDEVGPASIAKLVLARVERISAEAVSLARAVALFADGAALEDAATLAGLDETSAEDVAEALIAAQVLADEEPLRFVHPVMRRAVYDDASRFALRRGHTRAVTLLKQRGAAPDEIAAHLLAGAPGGGEADMLILLAAADEAERRRALAAAARYVERALTEDAGDAAERAALRARLGRLQALVAAPDAMDTLRAAIDETTDQTERLDLAIAFGHVAYGRQDSAAALADLTRLRATAEADPQRELALDTLIAGCAHYHDAALREQALARIPRDLPGDTEHERVALAELAYDAFLRGEPAAVVRELVLRSVGDTGEIELDVGSDIGDSTDLLTQCGDIPTAEALAQERIDRARETGAEAAYAAAGIVLVNCAAGRGDLLAVEATARLALAGRVTPRTTNLLQDRLHIALVRQGRLDEAAVLRAELRARDWSNVDAQEGRAAAAAGDAATAVAAFDRLRAINREHGIATAPMITWTPEYADALVALGRPGEALEALREFLALAQRFDEPRVLALAHLGLGRHNADGSGREHLERAHELVDGSIYRYEAALARAELGARLRRDNERAAARALLSPVLEYADQQRLAPLAARVREELRLAGSRPRDPDRVGVDALTPSEDRIARLAGGGMTNKQIAQSLFLTVKTVEMHLAGAYRKLDINSRHDLPAALGAAAQRAPSG